MNGKLTTNLMEWTDWDIAAYYVAQSLGIVSETEKFANVKFVFWTDNPLGNALHEILKSLVSCEILELQEEPDTQYRWNKRFKGDWE